MKWAATSGIGLPPRDSTTGKCRAGSAARRGHRRPIRRWPDWDPRRARGTGCSTCGQPHGISFERRACAKIGSSSPSCARPAILTRSARIGETDRRQDGWRPPSAPDTGFKRDSALGSAIDKQLKAAPARLSRDRHSDELGWRRLSSMALLASRSAWALSARPTCSNVTRPISCASRRAFAYSGCRPGCLTLKLPRICCTSSSESDRTWSDVCPCARAHSSAAISARYSGDVVGGDANRVAELLDQRAVGRLDADAVARRPGIAAGAAVDVRDNRVRSRHVSSRRQTQRSQSTPKKRPLRSGR